MKSCKEEISCPSIALPCTFSQNIESLADKLKQDLIASSTHPFSKKIIITPSQSIKEYLIGFFAKELEIVTGIQFLSLKQAINEWLFPFGKKMPDSIEISLVLEEIIEQSWQKDEMSKLYSYIACEEKSKRSKRIIGLSDQLSNIFEEYGAYGLHFLPIWIKKSGWQQTLWNQIFSSYPNWTYPLEATQFLQTQTRSIFVFGFSFLPLSYLKILKQVGSLFYFFSPCELFWEDVHTDRERSYLRKKLAQRGISIEKREELNHYDAAAHPLLANWGKLGRALLKNLDLFSLTSTEIYELKKESNNLQKLQEQILCFERTKPISQADSSLQLHSAPTKLREVEVLFDILTTLIQKNSISLDQIIVLAPDITLYASYIEMIFANHPLPYTIENVPIFSNSTAHGFLLLKKVLDESFSLNSIYALLEETIFCAKQGWSLDRSKQIKQWLKTASIRQEEEACNWDAGISRLLLGIVTLEPLESHWPIDVIALTDIELFSDFLCVFTSLQQDLSPLRSEKMTIGSWLLYIEALLLKYFDVENNEFLREIKQLQKRSQNLSLLHNYESIERIMDRLLRKKTKFQKTQHLRQIHFRSLQEGCIYPSQVIWMLGMNEELIPRMLQSSSLSELSQNPGLDYIPTCAEQDRYLLLEALFSAQKHLLFSYERIDSKDQKPKGCSFLIEELQACVALQIIDHPNLPFDSIYFQDHSQIKKSQIDYQAAKSYYFPNSQNKPFLAQDQTQPVTIPIIDVKQLYKLAKNPIRFFCQDVFQIFLEKEEPAGDFLFSNYQKAIFTKEVRTRPLHELLAQLEAQGKLPIGLFKDLALKKLQSEVAQMQKTLLHFDLQLNSLFSVSLSKECRKIEQLKCGNWIVPAIEIPFENQKIHIIGTLTDLSIKGLISKESNHLEGLIQIWPIYLIYLVLQSEMNMKASLFSLKDDSCLPLEIKDPISSMQKYLSYFFYARQTISPLKTNWAKALLLGTKSDFEKILLDENQLSTRIQDAYEKWLERRGFCFDAQETWNYWTPIFQSVFSELIGSL
ncbi:RecBCD enzyme subunit RecC [Candidatus Rhabdochlamydia oedothoracis]|uniref:RecBCD enzyme subunit RecC n=1 Tax=Candidatus Rhabdochlamydia oedothoracis TaxID=2720720 RepID=A0ABX8V4Q0_9BACT|nr:MULTISPECIES: exodeoxyribonuclease V subunit gamma [Rhabdochlamydia]KAG6559617.1 RecBCD enzyme subunit RecC [Candidatus Rhabdochlamydia sp. W815]QYF48010.1 RecBCD enzyme subunit RecC [Candidatus Rhabdochlamydia oedothoracis]